jgi:hypothetical protein
MIGEYPSYDNSVNSVNEWSPSVLDDTGTGDKEEMIQVNQVDFFY